MVFLKGVLIEASVNLLEISGQFQKCNQRLKTEKNLWTVLMNQSQLYRNHTLINLIVT